MLRASSPQRWGLLKLVPEPQSEESWNIPGSLIYDPEGITDSLGVLGFPGVCSCQACLVSGTISVSQVLGVSLGGLR